MNDKFDELAKGLAQSVTRRGALKKFGVGLAGIALTALGLTNKAEAARGCTSNADCPGRKVCNCHKPPPYHGCSPLDGNCIAYCRVYCNPV